MSGQTPTQLPDMDALSISNRNGEASQAAASHKEPSNTADHSVSGSVSFTPSVSSFTHLPILFQYHPPGSATFHAFHLVSLDLNLAELETVIAENLAAGRFQNTTGPGTIMTTNFNGKVRRLTVCWAADSKLPLDEFPRWTVLTEENLAAVLWRMQCMRGYDLVRITLGNEGVNKKGGDGKDGHVEEEADKEAKDEIASTT
ncbi:hypothetical protein MMC28_005514 [Mycoblastus sanguinarius]|nr:hypothetical protein [Mycoblastus sanguinarius]